MVQKMHPFSSFFQMADFFFLIQCPLVWHLCPDHLSLSPLESASRTWLPGGLLLGDMQSVCRAQSWMAWAVSWPSKLQLVSLFFQATASLTFRFDPHCFILRYKFSLPPLRFYQLLWSASSNTFQLTWTLVLWHLAYFRGSTTSQRSCIFKTCCIVSG